MVGEVARVLHVVRTLGPGGGMEMNLRRIAIETAHRGIQHAILLLNDQREVMELPAFVPLYRAVAPPRDPRILVQIARTIMRVQPTVIHARNWAAWPDT